MKESEFNGTCVHQRLMTNHVSHCHDAQVIVDRGVSEHKAISSFNILT